MITQISGTLVSKDLDRIEVMTASGLGYELHIPLSVFETLPKQGEPVQLHTSLVVKEDAWQLFGFSTPMERRLFLKLLTANGVGPALALGLMSSLTASRLIQAIVDKDINTLQSVPRVGRKKAERLVLDLADKLDDVQLGTGPSAERAGSGAHAIGGAADDAVRALVSLGYTAVEAERATRAALDAAGSGMGTAELVRAALAKIADRR